MDLHILQRDIQGLQAVCIAIRLEKDPRERYNKILTLKKAMSQLDERVSLIHDEALKEVPPPQAPRVTAEK